MFTGRSRSRSCKKTWRDIALDEQQALLDTFLRAERSRGFNLSEPPLLRIALFRVTDDAFRFVLTHHHLLMGRLVVRRIDPGSLREL